MLNIFKTKKITIPVDNAQTVTELESWTIEWNSYKHNMGSYADKKHNAKVFIKESEADEFEKQLNESAKFINSTVYIKKKKN